MKKLLMYSCLLLAAACKQGEEKKSGAAKTEFKYIADRFADAQVLRYEVKGFDELSLQQKKLAYYLYEAGLSGRDIFYDQKYRHNLLVRKTLEAILNTSKEDKSDPQYVQFSDYCKRVFFSNGIHHHYAADKFIPECSTEYFSKLVNSADPAALPLQGKSVSDFLAYIQPIIYDPAVDSKSVDLNASDVIAASANNFYEGVTQKEVDAFYAEMKKANPGDKSQLGLNSKVIKKDNKLVEQRWMVGGMYGPAIEKIVYWLEKAVTVTENETQKNTLLKLISFYRSGDPKDYDDYNISWVTDTASVIDMANGFIEVYQDAAQKKGAYESVLSLKDQVASKTIATIGANAQWFEDHSPIMDNHKKKNVKGISAKVITVIHEVGDAAPTTPIGINLPNNEWIREQHGSKSVSLGNIVQSYNYYRSKSPMLDEFGHSDSMIARIRQHGTLSADLHTDMHEVIGHASGQLNPGVAPTDVTLKNYAGVLEEARADLVGLYYIMDPKLMEIGVMPSLEVGKAQYDSYIMNGMMTQLNRIKLGNQIEQAHMRNRQLNSKWAYEKGKADNVIEKVTRDGKTYFVIRDYDKLRKLFGELLREIQRIKSEGDFASGKNLVETYGVKVDYELHKEVLSRFEKLNIAPYMGFIQPRLVPVMKGEEIVDVKVEYAEDFIQQHLDYGKTYGFLPVHN